MSKNQQPVKATKSVCTIDAINNKQVNKAGYDIKLRAKIVPFSHPSKEKDTTKSSTQTDILNQNIMDGFAEIAAYNPTFNVSDLKKYNTDYKSIFITGANGFLAVHLLEEILNNTNAKVYCGVRAETDAQAITRLKEGIAQYDIRIEDFSRVIALRSNLTEENLGLSDKMWNKLCHEVDAIYHAGAYVHHLQTYQRMAPTNVESTKTVINMATTHKLKRIHFTSTKYANITNFSNEAHEGMPSVCPPHRELAFGYVVTKWVAEWLLFKASNAGVPVDIYRFGDVSGHSQTGVSNYQKNNLTRFILGCLQMKKAPYYSMFIDTVPVDYVVKSIFSLSKQKYEGANGWNIINPNHINYTEYFKVIGELGYEFEMMEYNEWAKHLAQIDEYNLLAPLKNYYAKPSSLATIHIETTKTQHALRSNGIFIPIDYAQLLTNSFKYWKEVGFYKEEQKEKVA